MFIPQFFLIMLMIIAKKSPKPAAYIRMARGGQLSCLTSHNGILMNGPARWYRTTNK